MIYKQNKLLRTVKEFERVGNKYNINGIDLNEAIFFWRISQQLYDIIPKGSYNITTEGNNTYLNITDTTFNYERIQISYLFASISSEYEVDFNVDINILKDRYNEAVEDIKKIYAYVKSNIMIADGQDVTMILPSLGKNEVWVKTDDGYRGFDIGDLEANIQRQIELFEKTADEKIAELEAVKTTELDIIVKTVQDEGNRQVAKVNLEGTNQVNSITVEGNMQHDRIDNLLNTYSIDSKFLMMSDMFDVIVGSNRYLNGGNLEVRDFLFLDRTADGGDLSTRTGEPRSVYDGGNLEDRIGVLNPNIHPIVIDLGGVS